MFKQISFSPFTNNVLDFVGATDLVTQSLREPVKITHSPRGFAIDIDGRIVAEGLSNVAASYALNARCVGRFHRIPNGTKVYPITERTLRNWEGTILDASPLFGAAGWRYEVVPGDGYPFKLDPGQTVWMYSGELAVK